MAAATTGRPSRAKASPVLSIRCSTTASLRASATFAFFMPARLAMASAQLFNADLTQIAPYAVLCQMKTELQRAGQAPEAADFRRLFQILRTANYRGYVTLEYESREPAREACPRVLRQMRELCG